MNIKKLKTKKIFINFSLIHVELPVSVLDVVRVCKMYNINQIIVTQMA